ncbi:MAG TPA: M24 family metallopeptidase [Thermoleophilaceae bacterium]
MGDYPRFGDAEMRRRREALAAAMAEHGAAHAVIYGANRFGSAVGWLTGWPVTREALVVFTPGERDLLLVNFYNHVPNAGRLAADADVRWAGPRPMETAIEELRRRGGGRIGVVGPLGWRPHAALAAFAEEVVLLDTAYTGLRLRKSEEELEWLRVGCELTDSAVRALHEHAAPGVDERDLGDIVERAYVGRGGTTHIHYFAATPMDEPELGVPAQWPSARKLRRGDALTCEISASWWDYTGQLLRTFAVGAEPPPLYRELHAAADAAFDAILACLRPGASAADLVDTAGVIEDAGFTTRDDLVHGFVGGYLPPVLGSASRTLEPVPDFEFDAGMTVVVQPNVVTRDERAGVQTGELVLVTETGAERLHRFKRGLLRI